MSDPKPKPAASVDAFAELQKGERALPKPGAALMLAHMLVELGEVKVRAMTGDQVREFARMFVVRCHLAGPHLRTGHAEGFVRACALYGIACESPEHYQAAVSRLLPKPGPEDVERVQVDGQPGSVLRFRSSAA